MASGKDKKKKKKRQTKKKSAPPPESIGIPGGASGSMLGEPDGRISRTEPEPEQSETHADDGGGDEEEGL